MKKAFAAIFVLCLVTACIAQSTSAPAATTPPATAPSPTPQTTTTQPATASSPTWQREDKTDPLRGTSYSQFTLTGKFLTPPRTSTGEAPVFIVKCAPGGHRHISGGFINGKFLDAYITIHAVVNHLPRGVGVQYRLDDSKMHAELWNVGTDGTAIFLPEIEFNTVIYGHFLRHKEGTNDPVHKVVIGVNEYMGAEVVMQFDLPDPTEMVDACGELIRKE
jgi:hypothetical protein